MEVLMGLVALVTISLAINLSLRWYYWRRIIPRAKEVLDER